MFSGLRADSQSEMLRADTPVVRETEKLGMKAQSDNKK